MSSLQRTDRIFTTGLVFIPQNMPSKLLFICDNQTEVDYAIRQFERNHIPYHSEFFKEQTKLVSDCDLSVLGQKLMIAENKKIWESKRLKRVCPFRYPLMEIDTKDKGSFLACQEAYDYHKLPYYWHETANGYHFLSVKPVSESVYNNFMKKIKFMNHLCPMTTLRIEHNKWVGESDIWRNDGVCGPAHYDTIQLARAIREQDFAYLRLKYLVVRYRILGKDGDPLP